MRESKDRGVQQDKEAYFQVVRLDLEGREIGVFAGCTSERESRKVVDFHNANFRHTRLRRRRLDLSRLPSDAYGELE